MPLNDRSDLVGNLIEQPTLGNIGQGLVVAQVNEGAIQFLTFAGDNRFTRVPQPADRNAYPGMALTYTHSSGAIATLTTVGLRDTVTFPAAFDCDGTASTEPASIDVEFKCSIVSGPTSTTIVKQSGTFVLGGPTTFGITPQTFTLTLQRYTDPVLQCLTYRYADTSGNSLVAIRLNRLQCYARGEFSPYVQFTRSQFGGVVFPFVRLEYQSGPTFPTLPSGSLDANGVGQFLFDGASFPIAYPLQRFAWLDWSITRFSYASLLPDDQEGATFGVSDSLLFDTNSLNDSLPSSLRNTSLGLPIGVLWTKPVLIGLRMQSNSGTNFLIQPFFNPSEGDVSQDSANCIFRVEIKILGCTA